MLRTLYEKVNLFIYIIAPAITVTVYLFLQNRYRFHFDQVQSYQIELTYLILTLLLTVLGLMRRLPTRFRNHHHLKYLELMSKYHHNQIIYITLAIGITATIINILLHYFTPYLTVQNILFITAVTELTIAAKWFYATLKNLKSL